MTVGHEVTQILRAPVCVEVSGFFTDRVDVLLFCPTLFGDAGDGGEHPVPSDGVRWWSWNAGVRVLADKTVKGQKRRVRRRWCL